MKVFSEWDASFFDDLDKTLVELENDQIEYGYIKDEIHHGSGLPMGTLATIMEYGSDERNIPARPFVLYSAYILEENHTPFITAFNNYVYKKRGKEALKPLGRKGVRSIQTSIMTQDFAPLKPETVAKKGSSTILVENHELINSASYKIVPPEDS